MLTLLVRNLLLDEYGEERIIALLDRIETAHQEMVGGNLPFTPMLRKMQHDVYINHLKDALRDLRGYNLNHRVRRVISLHPAHPTCVCIREAAGILETEIERAERCCCEVM